MDKKKSFLKDSSARWCLYADISHRTRSRSVSTDTTHWTHQHENFISRMGAVNFLFHETALHFHILDVSGDISLQAEKAELESDH